jgi:predicted PurR-regulated permease PerM
MSETQGRPGGRGERSSRSRRSSGPKKPAWHQTRRFKFVLLAATAAVLLLLCGLLKGVFGPVAVALALAYIFEPVHCWFERQRIRRWASVVLIYVVGAAVVALFLVVFAPKVVSQTTRLYRYVKDAAARYGVTLESLSEPPPTLPKPLTDAPSEVEGTEKTEAAPSGEAPAEMEPEPKATGEAAPGAKPDEAAEAEGKKGSLEAVRDLVGKHADKIAVKAAGIFYTAFKRAYQGVVDFLGFVVNAFLVLFYTFFFMLGWGRIRETVKQYLPAGQRDRILRVLRDIDASLASFFRGRLIVSLISATVTSLGLYLSGIDYWLLIGLAAGILGFIPFIGIIVPLIPAVAFAVLGRHPGWSLLGVGITFGIVQAVVEPLIGTVIFSKELKLHPVTLVIALLVGGKLFGLFGAIMSIPLAAVAKILGREFLLPPLEELSRREGEEAGGGDDTDRGGRRPARPDGRTGGASGGEARPARKDSPSEQAGGDGRGSQPEERPAPEGGSATDRDRSTSPEEQGQTGRSRRRRGRRRRPRRDRNRTSGGGHDGPQPRPNEFVGDDE